MTDDLAWLTPITPENQAAALAQERDLRQQEADRTRTVTMTDWMKTAPEWLQNILTHGVGLWRNVEWIQDGTSDDETTMSEKRERSFRLPGAEVLSSRLERSANGHEKYHVIALDIDMPAVLIPSTTEGHYHLIIDHPLDQEDWEKFIRVCSEIGLIEQGYANVSLERGGTFLRLPWIRKRKEREDARAAMEEWLESDE